MSSMYQCDCGTPASWVLRVVDNVARETMRAHATCDAHLVSVAHEFDRKMVDDFDPKSVHIRLKRIDVIQ